MHSPLFISKQSKEVTVNYTVSDFYNSFQAGLKIVAGSGGMSRPVLDAGVLDYELEPGLKDKYFHSNFHENQLVTTTFLYAKDNPFLISDAVKHLIAKGASGLVIKNVFHLQIHDAVLRYADSKNFPIFIIDSPDVYIERIIYEVTRRSELLADIDFSNRELNFILSQELSDKEVKQHAKAINPSFGDQYFHLFIQFDDFFSSASFYQCCERLKCSDLDETGSSLISYRHGVLLTCSGDSIAERFCDSFIKHALEVLCDDGSYLSAGVGGCHLKLEEFKHSVQESLYAASAPARQSVTGQPHSSQTADSQTDGGQTHGSQANSSQAHSSPAYNSQTNSGQTNSGQTHVPQTYSYQTYSGLGAYKLIFPFYTAGEMQRFSHDLLEPILDYDIENNARLFDTLHTYIDLDCSLVETAAALSQHRNTVRYRLEKLSEIIGLDYKKFSHLEQLSLAIKIYNCARKKPL